MNQPVFQFFTNLQSQRQKALSVLLDPDKLDVATIASIVERSEAAKADCFFFGGSLVSGSGFAEKLAELKKLTSLPVIIFPGSTLQINNAADAILLLSLISGRNADLLIGKHVEAAPALKESGLEILPTGYLLIDGGAPTTVSYMSGTLPIPANKPDIAACTALAGEMLGLKLIYLDAGSGAEKSVAPALITEVREKVNLPIIVGGGISTPDMAFQAADAGADVVVVGNILEKDPDLIFNMADAVHAASHPPQSSPSSQSQSKLNPLER